MCGGGAGESVGEGRERVWGRGGRVCGGGAGESVGEGRERVWGGRESGSVTIDCLLLKYFTWLTKTSSRSDEILAW